MKRSNVNRKVMERVVRYERSRSYRAIEILAVMLLGFLSLLAVVTIDVFTNGMYDLPWLTVLVFLTLLAVIFLESYWLKKKIKNLRDKWELIKKYSS